MVPGRLPQRVRGQGWDVWLDAAGVLWTRDDRPLDETQAAVRTAAMERFLQRAEVLGVLFDHRDAASRPTPAAQAVYRRFVGAHARLPFAVVTSDGATREAALGTRSAAPGVRLAAFETVEAALRWLRLEGPRALTA